MNIVKEFIYYGLNEKALLSEQINDYLKEHPNYTISHIESNFEVETDVWWALVVFETNEKITSTDFMY